MTPRAGIQYVQAPQYIQALPPAQYDVAPQPAVWRLRTSASITSIAVSGWGTGFYPANYIVVNQVPNRRGHPGRGGDPVAPRPPIYGGGGPGHLAPLAAASGAGYRLRSLRTH